MKLYFGHSDKWLCFLYCKWTRPWRPLLLSFFAPIRTSEGPFPALTPNPLGGLVDLHLQIEACLRSMPDLGASSTFGSAAPGTEEGGAGRSGMFNSAPPLKECSSISNTMLLIAASEDLREPLLASSSQVSRLIFHYSEWALTNLSVLRQSETICGRRSTRNGF